MIQATQEQPDNISGSGALMRIVIQRDQIFVCVRTGTRLSDVLGVLGMMQKKLAEILDGSRSRKRARGVSQTSH